MLCFVRTGKYLPTIKYYRDIHRGSLVGTLQP